MINSDYQMSLLALAAADSVRWWLNVDGPVLSMIDDASVTQDRRGALTAQTVGAISKLYGFRRSMLGTASHDRMVAEVVSSHVRQEGCLEEQAKSLRALVERLTVQAAQLEGKTVRKLASGTSKLAWFVEPEGWTPFDSIAADGLKIPNGNALTRMVRFYAALDKIEFHALSRRLNEQVDRSEIGCYVSSRNRVRGERIIDRFLMFMGMSDVRRATETAIPRAFVKCLPEPTQSRLIALMGAIRDDAELAEAVASARLSTR